MAGTQGGGGLGSLAINYGVYRNMPSVTWAATIVIVIIVMLSQNWATRSQNEWITVNYFLYHFIHNKEKHEIKNLFAITAIASALVLTGCKEEKKQMQHQLHLQQHQSKLV